MKKLLSFAAALLASVNMFSATIDDVTVINDSYSVYFDELVSATVAKETLIGDYFFSPLGNNFANNKGSLNEHLYCLRVKSATQDALGFKLDRAATLVIYADRVSERAPKVNTEIAATGDNLIEGEVEVGAEGQKWGKVTYTIPAGGTYYIVGTGDLFLARVEFTLEAKCEDPEFTVLPKEGTGFVGDPIDIAVTSKNQSKPINAAVTVDGVAGVYGTDYSFSVSTGLVQATPLRAGTFVITFTQASDGTYCDAEASSTFVISEKTPVTSFTVEGPTSARVGDEITLTATDFNANPTRVWWLDPETGETIHEGATYTFKADAEGEVWYFVLARNEFNNPDEEDDNYARAVYGYVDVTMGHNAYLSDLKVNGVTIEGFDNEVFEYDLGEIGVYEQVEVTATAADEPYATATINPGNNNVLVTVFAQDKTTYHSYVITYTRKAATELAPISESTTWDFTKTGATTIQLSETTLPTKTQEFVYADLLTNPDESFNAAALAGIQEYVVRDGKFAQGSQLRFVTTVPGTLEVVYSNTGNRTDEGDRRFLVVNGEKIGEGSMNSNETVTESNIAVAAGEVALTGLLNKDESAQYLRFYKIVFTKSEETAIDNAAVDTKAVKVIRDGQVIILRDGKTYNALGAEVR
ncbi:MAG: hypothetical protein J6P74_04495 [Paludibacteraceae bacterium]|nr:hypothetical protein [Paludibacteraceae bacterium]